MLANHRRRGWTALVIALIGVCAHAQEIQESRQDMLLQQRLDVLAHAHQGQVALFARQLNTGRQVTMSPDVPVQTASVIKLALLYEAMEQVRAGKAHWADPITLRPGDGVSGSGLLQFFDTPLTLTLKDVLSMMIMVSDNTATNLAIDFLGLDAVNQRIRSLGLSDTYLYKKIGKPASGPMPADQPKFGLGKSTARQMAILMERIGRCQLDPEVSGKGKGPLSGTDKAICEVGLSMLRNQFYRETIPRYLEKLDTTEAGSGIASKTGSLDAVRVDVAIVAGKSGPMILSIFTYGNADHSWTVDNGAEVLIAQLAREIVEAWSPAGIDGKTLVPGLGLEPGESPAVRQATPSSSK